MAILYTNDRDPLCKRIWLENGNIKKQALGSLVSGHAQQIDADDPEKLGRIIGSVTQFQCLGLGNLVGRHSARLTLKGHEGPNEISRSKEFIKHLPVRSTVLFDFDDGGMPVEVRERIMRLGGPQAAIEHCAPDLVGCERLIIPSSSARIEGHDAWGLHYYAWIADGTQARQVLETMQAIAWLKGLGWIKIADDGALLVRSIFDVTVHSPERQIFEADPIVEPPLKLKPRSMIIERGALFQPPTLTAEMKAEARLRIAQAKGELREPARQIRVAWYETQSQEKGISVAEFKKVWEEQAPLPDSLLLADGRTLGEVLDEYDRRGEPILIHDPFFPEKGPSKAAILPRKGRHPAPTLWSYLHGGRAFPLERYVKAPAKFPKPGVSLAEGEAKLEKAFKGASASRRLIKATQGLGKTRAAVADMSAFPGIVACFVRSHDNAEELKRKFAEDVRVIVVHGRRHEGMCQNYDRVERAIRNEQVVPRDVCAFCPFRESCAYLEQEKTIRKASRDGQPLVLLLAHNYLWSDIPGDPRIDWAIVDEMPSGFCTVQAEIGLPLGPYESVFKPIPRPTGKKATPEAWDQWSAYIDLERKGRELIREILASPTLEIDLPAGATGWPWRDRFRELILGLAERKHRPNRVWWENGKLWVSRLREINLPAGLPLTFLDGTASPEIVRAIFGDDIEVIEIPVERDAHVTCVTGKSFSNSTITGEGQDGDWSESALTFREQLGLGFARYRKPFLAATQAVLSSLGWAGSQRHFGALRGINKFEDCETAIVLGRMLPPPAEVERIARAFAGRDFRSIAGEEEWYHRRYEGLRMADGGSHALPVECHPDPWGQTILEQICDAEIAQAMDRVRAVRHRREIVLLTPRVVDVTVDRVVSWRDWTKGGVRAAKMVEAAGFALLSDSERARCFPDLWANRDAARDDDSSRTWLEEQTGSIVFTYRSAEKRGTKPHKASATETLPTPARLTEVVGPLALYRVEGDPNEVLAALVPPVKEGRDPGEILAGLIASAGKRGILIA